jgi:hypothetical protein
MYLYYFVYSLNDVGFLKLKNTGETSQMSSYILLLVVQIVRFSTYFVMRHICNVMMNEICPAFFKDKILLLGTGSISIQRPNTRLTPAQLGRIICLALNILPFKIALCGATATIFLTLTCLWIPMLSLNLSASCL